MRKVSLRHFKFLLTSIFMLVKRSFFSFSLKRKKKEIVNQKFHIDYEIRMQIKQSRFVPTQQIKQIQQLQVLY